MITSEAVADPGSRASALAVRPATVQDGYPVWKLVGDSGVLDVNSVYCYLLLFEQFRETCLVAERNGSVVGFVAAFKPPGRPDTVFVWQIGVDASVRGRGLGKLLLERLLVRPACRDIVWLETTVTPSNRPSRALFQGLAQRHGVHCKITVGFDRSLFGNEETGDHESEELYRIGPFQPRLEES